MSNSSRPAFAALFALVLFSAPAAFAASPVNKTLLGSAVDGYDVVAYFTRQKPMKGKDEFSHEWKGATWKFASAEHRDLFAADPERYAPRYGGYCAYAVSQGATAGIDPKAWTIHEGRLYLNLNPQIQRTWSSDIPGYVKQADANWPRLSGE